MTKDVMLCEKLKQYVSETEDCVYAHILSYKQWSTQVSNDWWIEKPYENREIIEKLIVVIHVQWNFSEPQKQSRFHVVL